jgi:hypothetical protein
LVSKSATADFDARVSKDGSDHGRCNSHAMEVAVAILRDAVLRTAPQDEVAKSWLELQNGLSQR